MPTAPKAVFALVCAIVAVVLAVVAWFVPQARVPLNVAATGILAIGFAVYLT